MKQTCSLCQQTLAEHPIIDQALHFCCSGCQAVFSILSVKGEAGNYQESPLFMQALRSGVISNPALLERMQKRAEELSSEESIKFYFEVSEMWCPSCAEVIRLILLQERGIKTCHIDYATDLAAVEFFPRILSKERIFKCIESLGYGPKTLEEKSQKAVSNTLYLRFILSAFCAFNAMMFAYPLYATYFDEKSASYNLLFAWISFFLAVPVIGYTGWPIFSRFWSSLSVGLVGMEALVTLGVFAAFLLSTVELFSGGTQVYFDSMSVIVAFVLLGKIIENKAKFSAKEALFRLNLSLPKRGRKQMADGSCKFMPIKELAIGDLIEVRMGEMIVLDGTVASGEGICNEALMTGEALPVVKRLGERVVGGTYLQHGALVVNVTAASQQSTLQHIVDIIEQQMRSKEAYIRPADVIVRWFVPLVLAIAGITALACLWLNLSDGGRSAQETAFLRAIAVLLISCPCAIGIAAPTAESALIQALAACGAIVRNRACLRYLGAETALVFDKTGTITQGHFAVLEGLEKLSFDEKAILKALVNKSNHPISYALHTALSILPAQLTACEEIAGKGVRGAVNDRFYFLGSSKFLSEQGVLVSEVAVREGGIHTVVYFAVSASKVIPLILGDELKAEAREVVCSFKNVQTCLVSGDAQASVSYVASICGFKQWQAQASPLDKQYYVEQLKNQGHLVGMIGDGVNDSPALASAHVGISVATATDISIQVSDILLTGDKLSILPHLHTLAKKGRRILKQNLFWAFFYNVIGIALAVCGWLSPIFAAFAMTASSLIVILNAMRLKGVLR